jgi:hypothetical protein
MYLPNATSTYAYNPPVKDTRLPAIAKQVTNRIIAIAQHTNASGAADPSPCATVAGITKIPAPIVELTIFAVSDGMPMPRTSCSSVCFACSVIVAASSAMSRMVRDHAKGNKRKPLGSQVSSNKSLDLVSTTTRRVSSPERGLHCKRKEVRRPRHGELRPPLNHPHILRLAARSAR